MIFKIDFSIFTNNFKAFGSVNGSMELGVLPSVGDKILFTKPKKDMPFPFDGFDGCVMVKQRIFFASKENDPPLVLLSELTVQTDGDAVALTKYLEEGFGFFVDLYDDGGCQ